MPGYDIRIIGGGPAGAAAAIRLTQAGRRVQLFEKGHFPRHKVCGGFISGEALHDLEQLGVLATLHSSGARTVNRIVIASASGEQVSAPLPVPGLSLSRRVFDSILINQARASGVQVTEGVDGFFNQERSLWTVVACGRGTSAHTGAAVSRTPRYYGVQAFFEDVTGLSDQVELDFVPGAYVGMVCQAAAVNVCLLADQRSFHGTGSDLDALVKSLTMQNRILFVHLASARRTSPWKAVGPVQMGLRDLSAPGRFFVGDAACVVDPFTGEGLAMGLRASALLAEALAQTERPPEEAYARAWHQAFDSALRLDGLVRHTLGHRLLQEVVVRGFKIVPQALTRLAERTRPAVLSVL